MICLATNLAPLKTIGTPVPGWVLAPTKYRFLNRWLRVDGRKNSTWKMLCDSPRIEPFHKLNLDCQVRGSLMTSVSMSSSKFIIFSRISIVLMTFARAVFTISSMQLTLLGAMWLTGRRTTTVSLPSGAAATHDSTRKIEVNQKNSKNNVKQCFNKHFGLLDVKSTYRLDPYEMEHEHKMMDHRAKYASWRCHRSLLDSFQPWKYCAHAILWPFVSTPSRKRSKMMLADFSLQACGRTLSAATVCCMHTPNLQWIFVVVKNNYA